LSGAREVSELLEKAYAERAYVWVYGPHACFMGFVLGLSESFVLVQRFQDFAEYGYALVRRDTIGDVLYRTRPLAFFEQMMEREGVLERVGLPFELPIGSMSVALRSIQQNRALVMFELDLADEDGEWPVGEVLSADDARTELRHVSAWGEWEDRIRTLETSLIQRIEFESPYLRALAKYAPRAMQ
jgi:hypothetical protein